MILIGLLTSGNEIITVLQQQQQQVVVSSSSQLQLKPQSQILTNDKFCINCGTRIPKAAIFCSNCGEKQLI